MIRGLYFTFAGEVGSKLRQVAGNEIEIPEVLYLGKRGHEIISQR